MILIVVWDDEFINTSKIKTKFFLWLHYNGDNSYSFVDGKNLQV